MRKLGVKKSNSLFLISFLLIYFNQVNFTSVSGFPLFSIVSLQKSGNHICGGVFINEKWILTAAHCIGPFFPRSFSIRAGSSVRESGGEVIPIRSIHRHPEFNGQNYDNDFALLELEEEWDKNNTRYSPVNLPTPFEDIPDGTNLKIYGWGYTEEEEFSDVLKSAVVPKVNQELCNKSYLARGGITPRMICAGYYKTGGVDSCKGDSGGPLFFMDTLVGITSFGKNCGEPYHPGVYAKVSHVIDWIQQKITERESENE